MDEGLERFRSIYNTYVGSVLEPSADCIRSVFDEWKAPEYWASYRRFAESAVPVPTQRVKVRIKRIESVLDKFRRMPDEFPGAPDVDNLMRMRDALGARVVVFFPSQLSMIDREIRTGRHFEISESSVPKSYLPLHLMEELNLDPAGFRGGSKKPSGYASLHYIVRLADPPASGNPWFELQTRTMLEEVWGEVEHQIGYKPDQHTDFSVKRQFRVISDHLTALDSHFDFINNELAFLQANAETGDNDLLNAENLPSVLRRIECVLLQREINGLLRVLEVYGVTTVGALLRLARIDIVEAIQAEFRRLKGGRTPTAFDIVPILLQLPNGASPDDARKSLRLHVEVADQERKRRSAGP